VISQAQERKAAEAGGHQQRLKIVRRRVRPPGRKPRRPRDPGTPSSG
jgi:hypothetical protein